MTNGLLNITMMKISKRIRLQAEVNDMFIRGEHPDTRSNAEWVKQMNANGWNWDKGTKGQSEWKRVNAKQ